LKPLIEPKQIADKIQKIAHEINRDYAGKDLVILMVLKGSICLAADLIRALEVPFELDFAQCASYGTRGINKGDLQIFGLERLNFERRDVLVVDDIFDSGETMAFLIEALKKKNPHSLKSLVLLSKNVKRNISYRPDYVLFDIENHFVVGFGLDYKERYRGLPGIFIFKEES